MALTSDEQDLWHRLRGQGDRQAHQLIFIRYSSWAHAVARDVYRRVRITQLDWSDYSQNAVVGLLEAIDRYDHRRGIDFIAYAKSRVRGSVFNGLRTFLAENSQKSSWEDRRSERFDSFHRQGDGDELTQFVSVVSGLAIGYLLDSLSEPEFIEQALHVEQQIDAHRVGVRLKEAIRRLPEKEEMVVGLHYLQHVPFVEIARLLGVTKGRVSQIHKAAIARLRSCSLLGDCRESV